MHDLIIIGGGPAGIGAALQAHNQGLDMLLIEQGTVGGRLVHARAVRNFPLYEGPGLVVARRLAAQLSRRRIDVTREQCRGILTRGKMLIVRCQNREYQARSVIVATGVTPQPFPGVKPGMVLEYWDGIKIKRRHSVAVIGGGETAFDQACSLAEHGAAVSLLLRGRQPRAHAELVRCAVALGVHILADASIIRIEWMERRHLITLTGGRSLVAHHVLPAIGGKAVLPVLAAGARGQIDRSIFIAGDAREGSVRQAAVALGDGVESAMRAHEYLRRCSE